MSKTKARTKTKSKTIIFPGGWRLFRDSLSDFGLHPWRYLFLVGIVAVPTNLISLATVIAGDPTTILYENLGSIFMTTALIWAVTHAQKDDSMKLRQAYYEGSTMAVRFILILVVLAAMSIPAAVGLSLYSLGTSTATGTAPLPVQLILGGLAILLAIPTFYWMVRYGLVIIRLAITDEWPIAALKSIRRLTLGYFWPLARRAAQLVLWILLLMIVPGIVFVTLAAATHAVIFIIFLQLSFSLVIWPFSALYIYRLYRVLTEV